MYTGEEIVAAREEIVAVGEGVVAVGEGVVAVGEGVVAVGYINDMRGEIICEEVNLFFKFSFCLSTVCHSECAYL